MHVDLADMRSLIENDECRSELTISGVIGMLPLDLLDSIVTRLLRIDLSKGVWQANGTLAVQAFTSTCRGALGCLSREHAIELKSRREMHLALTPDLVNETYPYTMLMLRSIRSRLEQCILDGFLGHYPGVVVTETVLVPPYQITTSDPIKFQTDDHLTRMAMGNRNLMSVKCMASGTCRLLCSAKDGLIFAKNDRDVFYAQSTSQSQFDLNSVLCSGYEYSAAMYDECMLAILTRDAYEQQLETPSTYTVTTRNVTNGEVVNKDKITVGDESHCAQLLTAWVHQAELWAAFCVSGMGYTRAQVEVQLFRIIHSERGKKWATEMTRLPVFDKLKSLSVSSQTNNLAVMEGLRGNRSVMLHFFDVNTLELANVDVFDLYRHKTTKVELSPDGNVMAVIAQQTIYIYHRSGGKRDPMGWRRVAETSLAAGVTDCTLETSVFSPCGSRILYFFHGGCILAIDVALSLRSATVCYSHRYCVIPSLDAVQAVWSNGLFLLTKDQNVLWFGLV